MFCWFYGIQSTVALLLPKSVLFQKIIRFQVVDDTQITHLPRLLVTYIEYGRVNIWFGYFVFECRIYLRWLFNFKTTVVEETLQVLFNPLLG